MAVQSRVAAVTGANKGIGVAIVRNLALEYPKSPFKSGPFLIYLTARSPERGAEAVETLNNDPELKKAKVLSQDGGDTTITYHALDISQTKSVQDFRDFLHGKHPDGIDILINNAGIAQQGFDANVVKETLETNYYGTLEACQSLLPLIREGGRLVNVSSMAGKLNKYSDEITKAFLDASKKEPETGIPEVTSLMQKFQKAVHAGQEKEAGFPSMAYATSKAGVTAFTKSLALDKDAMSKNVLINACCPGYVKTDMTRGGGRKSADEGARTPVMLALHDIGGKTGEYWQHEEIAQWRE
ncbi:Carbonyl reductase [NADPH] 1 [Pseudocercospora fuligena]|uniref:Carbonyl reductase [NADPH] 1 n=1 Tax=Pseudocercospora fuligena TaxID=685502 RepID=A0A8H6RLS2_9PEZI|nr:Carbonyl reductase [NADPH] 1 [Pseudocercospora fuligena]